VCCAWLCMAVHGCCTTVAGPIVRACAKSWTGSRVFVEEWAGPLGMLGCAVHGCARLSHHMHVFITMLHCVCVAAWQIQLC
jgi:hypothetical protein